MVCPALACTPASVGPLSTISIRRRGSDGLLKAVAARSERYDSVSLFTSDQLADSTSVVPRICTLDRFASEESYTAVPSSNAITMIRQPDAASAPSMTTLMLQTMKAASQVKNFETICGRFAMVGFASALSVEYITGHSVFSSLDMEQLIHFFGLCFLTVGSAALFALAWRSKAEVSIGIAKQCKEFADYAVDSIVEGLLFDDGLDKSRWRGTNDSN